MTKLVINGMWRALIKGCAWQALEREEVGPRGIRLDHNWMVVDERGMFVTQRGSREHGSVGVRSMCLVKPEVVGEFVRVNAPNMPPLWFPLKTARAKVCPVQVWSWQGEAIEMSPACNGWFTEFLSREKPGEYRLVEFADHVSRKTKTGDAEMAFHDGFPFMLISQESMDDLNGRLEGDPVPPDRFRPTFTFSGGGQPYFEDEITSLQKEGLVLTGQKKCDRCDVPSYDQSTAQIDARPIRALSEYRRWDDDKGKPKVWFGRNFTHQGTGPIGVGDVLEAP